MIECLLCFYYMCDVYMQDKRRCAVRARVERVISHERGLIG